MREAHRLSSEGRGLGIRVGDESVAGLGVGAGPRAGDDCLRAEDPASEFRALDRLGGAGLRGVGAAFSG
jgi:hypothetical protein